MALIRIERDDADKEDAPELRQKLREASDQLSAKLKPLEKRKFRIDSNLRKSQRSLNEGPVKFSR